ncbi:MAG: ATPase [Eubacteriaceae bacterium]|nr:ATPase [Eubacteriaceae bacterium]
MDEEAKRLIENGEAFLGIELGSTRIKAVLIDGKFNVLSQGIFDWENKLIDGYWTYSIEEIDEGIRACYSSLADDVRKNYGVTLKRFKAGGISAMMHGYMPFDKDGRLLVPFRTWRNTTTGAAAAELSELFDFNIPQRWSIAHMYQAILNKEPHIADISFITTLAGYIHYRLTGVNAVGIGEASGMFPIDSTINNYDKNMKAAFDRLLKEKGLTYTLDDILPDVLPAGADAGSLTAQGASFLDPSGELEDGIPFCPPEGDAGTGMCATNSVRVRTGNVSAGTSIFAMVVLEKPLAHRHTEIDMVTTPSGKPVAMVHCNNCTCDIDAWVEVFSDFAELNGLRIEKTDLYSMLFNAALRGEPDCGGLLSYNYYSGEPVMDTEKGSAVMLHDIATHLSLKNFMRSLIYSSFTTLAIGMDILKQEDVRIDKLTGHGGLFKTPMVAQKLLADALNTIVATNETASEGGPWGMALLAAYRMEKNTDETLEDFLESRVFATAKTTVAEPDERGTQGFEAYKKNYIACFDIERTAGRLFDKDSRDA